MTWFLAAASGGAGGGGGTFLLGDDLLAYLVLAIGGAMVVGSAAAIFRPREETREGDLERPPLVRSAVFIAIGLVGTIWALATLTS